MEIAVGVIIMIVLGILGILALPKRAAGASAGPVAEPGPAPAAKYPYSGLIVAAGSKYGVDTDLVAAIIKVESAWDPNSENKEDPALDYDSSYGLMQVQLAVAQDFGAVKDYRHATAGEIAWLRVPENNINAGTWSVSRWLKKYPFDVAIQMENVGETGYNQKGRRNVAHLNKIKAAYNEYKNQS